MTSNSSRISFRAEERIEAYLPGTGLAVWEVAWVAEGHAGDVEKTAQDLDIDCALVRDALAYAAEHPVEIGTQIHDHVSWTEEDVRRVFPRVRVLTVDVNGPMPPSS